ncbi:DsbE family thiol:disulfide interchange protein [Pelagibacterales bacterium SAG-MED06]|nr:DsbE family thiol:disulfide interchange protein [Pelagibacterales bacterium SAG-MED06]
MKNKLIPLSIFLVFIVIFIIFYKGLQNTNIYTPGTKTSFEVPSVSAKLFNSNEIVNTLEIFSSDKFYLLNIWSSWCVPCRQEHSILMELSKNDNLRVIGINYKDTKKNANNFLKELGNPYDNIIFDNKGTNAIEWGAYGVPESFLINNNKIIKKYIGPLNERSMEEIKSFIK